MIPAFLADVAVGDRIRFRLPATRGFVTFDGTLTAYERGQHAVGVPTVAFRIDTADRTFTCRPDLHVELAAHDLLAR